MKTLLVMAPHPGLVEALANALDKGVYRLIHRRDPEEAEPLLRGGLADAAVLDVEGLEVQGFWMVEKVRALAPGLPVVVYAAEGRDWEWEEEAYLQGVSHVLSKPVRGRMLQVLLARSWAQGRAVSPGPDAPYAGKAGTPPSSDKAVAGAVFSQGAGSFRSLEALRHFSSILSHSLKADEFLHQFLLRLREVIGINRAVIFLRRSASLEGRAQEDVPGGHPMRSACALGLPTGLLTHFELSFESGIGGYLFRHGRILQRDSEEVRRDEMMRKEFEVLGVQVAIPILDRETLVGVAALDGRVTGESLSNSELELIFHLLEQLGLAVRNIWLYDQLSANHGMMTEVLRELSMACVVVGKQLQIHHCNRAARKLLFRSLERGLSPEFSNLPPLLGSKVYQVLQTGSALVPFKFELAGSPATDLQIAIIPLVRQEGAGPESVLLMADDQTQANLLRRLEKETEDLRLIRTMADRLAHEIGNAMVPLATHQQLLGEKYRDAEFRASMEQALGDGVKRVGRFVKQMRFLARDELQREESFPLVPLLEDAFQEAHQHQTVKSARLKYKQHQKELTIAGERQALKHAFSEIMLNALQANADDPSIGVTMEVESDEEGRERVKVEVRDNGPGFSEELRPQLPKPFLTRRTVGLGLGLCVSRKILRWHHGELEIVPANEPPAGVVRVTLPLGNSD